MAGTSSFLSRPGELQFFFTKIGLRLNPIFPPKNRIEPAQSDFRREGSKTDLNMFNNRDAERARLAPGKHAQNTGQIRAQIGPGLSQTKVG